MKSGIVIPAYRAARTLQGVLDRVPKEFWTDGLAIIVNDGSPDDTGAVAESLVNRFPALHVIHHPSNQGYGAALKTGLRHGMGEGVEAFAIVHADGQYPVELVFKMIQPVAQSEAQIVQGSRMLAGGAREGGMPLIRYLANRALTILENIAFGTHLAEFHSGFMVYSRQLLEEAPYEELQDNFNFDAEMILVAHLLSYPCKEIAIPTRYDEETSSLAPIPYGIAVLKMILRHLLGHYRRLIARKK